MSSMDIKDKKILLIGGAGFIGHNLALHLKSYGANVTILDSLSVNNIITFKNNQINQEDKNISIFNLNNRQLLLRKAGIPIYIQDARDYHALGKYFESIKPNIVIQLAAVSHANISNKDPYNTFDHSMRTLENALDCSRNDVEHFIFFSSSMVYGNFQSNEVSEESNCSPIGIYGALKYGGEKLVIAYNQVFGLPYTIIRPSALYGERCVSNRVGQRFIENALKGNDITLHGDGSDRLDFTYILDLIDGIKLIIENENSKNEIFNLTFGKSKKLIDMANIIKSEFPDIKVLYKEKDKLTPNRGTLSVKKARDYINYNPKYSLDKGYVSYIRWYKKTYQEFFDIRNH
tara:strand:+ start:1799 stop:2836 length:1038 start_codon:yes stop_codon:yes gene_type:complete